MNTGFLVFLVFSFFIFFSTTVTDLLLLYQACTTLSELSIRNAKAGHKIHEQCTWYLWMNDLQHYLIKERFQNAGNSLVTILQQIFQSLYSTCPLSRVVTVARNLQSTNKKKKDLASIWHIWAPTQIPQK